MRDFMGITKWPMESKFAKYEYFKQPIYSIVKNRPVDLSSTVSELNSIATLGPFDLFEFEAIRRTEEKTRPIPTGR